jgi:cell wall-associated NlpC family hydrolase
MIRLRRYIGIPFVDRGDQFTGADCYGLLRLFYREELGISIMDPHISCRETGKVFSQYLVEVRRHWVEVTEPGEFCGVAMATDPKLPGIVNHFGIWIGGRLLQTLSGVGSHVVPADKHRNRIIKYYQWQA